jgi:glucose 1-dehydrogenase
LSEISALGGTAIGAYADVNGRLAVMLINTAYCLAKGGVRMLVRTAGVELAPHGVTVVNTPINAPTINNPELLAKLNSAIPMGRMAEPSETATSIFVDGGILQSNLGI